MRYDAKNGITILLVDSDEKFLRMLYFILKKKLPYHIIAERSATRGLLKSDKIPVHLILTAINMPKIDGFRMLTLIHNDEKLVNVPVIFVTERRDQQSVVKAIEAGVDDYIKKPVIPEEIIERCVQFIKKSVTFNVLVVDGDEKIFPDIIEMIQVGFPYQTKIFTANSAPAGLEIIDTNEVNLLILGNNMPIVSGVRMLDLLNDKEQLEKLSVVFMPDDLNVEERHRIAELGIEFFAERNIFQPEWFGEICMDALNLKPPPEFDDLSPD